MSALNTKPKILVVVGPTASGKTGLSIELAKQFDGEVISADSRQVYRGMDIGSAKVTPEEMQGIPHHLLDIADPKEAYNASDFKRDAEVAVTDILSRGKLPIVCGGTFFYVDTLLGKFSLPEVEPNEELRAELEEKSAAELLTILKELDPKRANSIEPRNPRRLIRAIEVAKKLGHVPEPKEVESPYEAFTIGLTVDIESHAEIIRKRLFERLDAGMIGEVERLLAEGVTHERLESFGLEYRYVSRYLRGEIDYETMINEIVTKSRQFAKRQITWLKRDQSINWFDKDDSHLFDQVKQFLVN
ncbi:MAG: tRNA (adenosine(37)-N6)-dimethylallyltransferase MiaA [Candidatus Paceibacterota bacterium]